MKPKITLLAINAALLLTACGQKANDQIGVTPPSAATVQEETQPPQPFTEPTTAEQPKVPSSTSVQERPQEDGSQPETTSQVNQVPEPVTEPALTEDILSATVPAKTGCDEDSVPTPAPESESEPTPVPEPAPEPAALADRQATIDVANAYAVSQYGVTTDGGLTLDNSAYRFPAAVPVDASQETLEAKARDMVDFTFHQFMMQAGVDSLADAGFRCNVCIIGDGDSLLLYVLYDG